MTKLQIHVCCSCRVMWVFLAKPVILDLKERRSAHCCETVEAKVAFNDHDGICCHFCCCDGGDGREMLDHMVCLARRDRGEPLEKTVIEAQWERKGILD